MEIDSSDNFCEIHTRHYHLSPYHQGEVEILTSELRNILSRMI